jgi:hypothetical protein
MAGPILGISFEMFLATLFTPRVRSVHGYYLNKKKRLPTPLCPPRAEEKVLSKRYSDSPLALRTIEIPGGHAGELHPFPSRTRKLSPPRPMILLP